MSLVFKLALQFLYAFVAIIGFCVLFNSPRKLNVYSALSGAMAWVVYHLLAEGNLPYILPYTIGSLIVGLFSESFARRLKHPSIVFTIPALIPFVPGYGIYYTMLYTIEKKYDLAVKSGAEAFFIAIAIATGIVVATSLTRMIFKKNLIK